jgi:hypothetical protein
VKGAAGFRVDFLLPGFSKCGTTTLSSMLNGHPQLYMPQGDMKEPLYFIFEENEERKRDYRNVFAAASDTQLLGEASTFYTSHLHERDARDRILRHNPDIKLIFIVRDPLDRIESAFREFHHSGHRYAVDTPFDLGAAIAQLPALVEDSRYWRRIGTFRERFPDRQMLLVFLEEFEQSPLAVLQDCYRFLGVDEAFRNADLRVRANAGENKLADSALLRRLRHLPLTRQRIAAMPATSQDRLFRKWGLRKPLRAPILWRDEVRRAVVRELAQDVDSLLAHAGKQASLWPSFADARMRS